MSGDRERIDATTTDTNIWVNYLVCSINRGVRLLAVERHRFSVVVMSIGEGNQPVVRGDGFGGQPTCDDKGRNDRRREDQKDDRDLELDRSEGIGSGEHHPDGRARKKDDE